MGEVSVSRAKSAGMLIVVLIMEVPNSRLGGAREPVSAI
jgi:hypothetical protein